MRIRVGQSRKNHGQDGRDRDGQVIEPTVDHQQVVGLRAGYWTGLKGRAGALILMALMSFITGVAGAAHLVSLASLALAVEASGGVGGSFLAGPVPSGRNRTFDPRIGWSRAPAGRRRSGLLSGRAPSPPEPRASLTGSIRAGTFTDFAATT